MEIIKAVIFVVLIIGFGTYVFSRHWLRGELERNEEHEAPSDQQLKWHIRHLREDMHALVLINCAILVVIAAGTFFNF